MAVTRYGVATEDWSSTDVWSATTGGAPGASAPGDTDTAWFDVASGAITVTMDGDIATLAYFWMSGTAATLAMGEYDLTADLIDIAGGTPVITGGAGAVLTSNGVGGGDIADVDFSGFAGKFVWNNAGDTMVGMYRLTGRPNVEKTGAGNLTLDSDSSYAFQTANFTVSAGTATIFVAAGALIDAQGDVIVGAAGTLALGSGSVIATGAFTLVDGGVLTGTADSSIHATGLASAGAGLAGFLGKFRLTDDGTVTVSGSYLRLEVAAGVQATQAGTVAIREFIGEAGATFVGNAGSFYILPIASGFWSFPGSITGVGALVIAPNASYSNGAIDVTGFSSVVVKGADTKSLTMTGDFLAGTKALAVYANSGVDGLWTLTMNAGCKLQVGAMVVGEAVNNRCGAIVLNSGDHEIGSLAAAGTGTLNAVTFNNAKVAMGGAWAFDNITVDLGTSAIIPSGSYTLDGAGALAVVGAGGDAFSNGADVLTVSNLTVTVQNLRAWCGVVDGGGNSGVDFFPVPPDQLDYAA